MRPKAEWAIDSVSKIQLVGLKNIETKHLSLVKARLQSIFAAVTNMADAFHYKWAITYSLVGLEITAGQRIMSRLIVDLTGQTFVLPVMLSSQNSIVLKMK